MTWDLCQGCALRCAGWMAVRRPVPLKLTGTDRGAAEKERPIGLLGKLMGPTHRWIILIC
jgi:hypothetical protein